MKELSNTEKRRIRMNAAREKGRHTKDEWEKMKLFHCEECVICKRVLSLCKDHILPVFAGGSDSIDNIQPLCTSCNSRKGYEDIDHRKIGWEIYVKGVK